MEPNEKPNDQDFSLLQDKEVLLAEDDQLIARVISQILGKYGIKTDHALNGKLAFEQSQQKKYDFILMDVHMPEMNGIAAANLIRSDDNPNKDVPIFAVTADIMVNNDDDYLPLFNEFLFKPLDIERLHGALVKYHKNNP